MSDCCENRTGVRRVLMTADTIGGVWTYALELARGLVNNGTQVAVATMGRPLSRDQREEAGAIRGVSLYESSFKLEWMEDPWKDIDSAGEWLLRLEEEIVPDVVHLNCYAFGSLPWKAPVLVVAHSCVLSWWESVRKTPLPPVFGKYAECVRKGLAGADLVVAPSRWMLRAVERLYGSVCGTVIYNSRSRRFFKPGTKESFILSAGRIWDEAKNIRTLAKAAGSLQWPVYAAGEEDHPEGGALRFANLKILGNLDTRELAAWYAAAPIYALPARYEPFGLTVLEAAMSGCALVLGDIPTFRELWDGAAIFVPPDDTEALAEALRNLCGDPLRYASWGEKARCRSLDFETARTVREYLEAYRSICADSMAVPRLGNFLSGGNRGCAS